MNKNGLSFKLMFFGIIVAGLLLIAVGGWVTDWDIKYSSGVTYDLNSYSKLEDMKDTSKDIQSSITVESTTSGEDFEGTSIRGVFGVLNNMFSYVRIITEEGGVLDQVFNRYGMPRYIKLALTSMISIAIAFTLVAIFFRLTKKNI